MSLFHVEEWFSALYPNAWAMAVDQLLPGRSHQQIVIGTLDGLLAVLDPGRSASGPHNTQQSSIAELQLDQPILQLTTGRFLPGSMEQNLIAALHPNLVTFFQVNSSAHDKEAFICEQVFSHKIGGPPAFNMCQGNFGRSSTLQFDALHPGPLLYSPFSESLLTTPGGYLTSVRYAVLPSILRIDWSIDLGETALQLAVVGTTPIQPSILVLCKRTLFCYTHGGNPRFQIRFQCVTLCLRVYEPNPGRDPCIQFCVGLSTKTLAFYRDTRMVWTAQLQQAPVAVELFSPSETIRSMLALLGDDGRVQVAYLGTEPALFKMPVTQTRFIDFEQRKAELKEFEETIWRYSRDNPTAKGNKTGFTVDVAVSLNPNIESHPDGGVRQAIATLAVDGVIRDTLDVVFQWPEGIQASRCYVTISSSDVGRPFQIVLNCVKPIFDHRCQAATVCGSEILQIEFTLPLAILYRETQSQRNASFKLTVDASRETLDLAKIFPEFRPENQNSLGLQPQLVSESNAAVSIFVAPKTNRYRIQSDRPDFCFIIFTELLKRVPALQSGIELRCSSAPITQMLTGIAEYLEMENSSDQLEKEANRSAVQMRNVETLFLSRMKTMSEEETPTHINVLMNYSYRELNGFLERLIESRGRLGQLRRSLRSLIGIAVRSMRLAGITLPFSEYLLDGGEQSFGERLAQTLSEASGSPLSTSENPVELCRAIASLCESSSTGHLSQIVELGEEDEEDEEERERKFQEEMKKALAGVEPAMEFVSLESGSLPATGIHGVEE